MKKTCLYILSFFILFPLSTNAKTIKYFGVGTTSAALRSEGGKSEWGKFIGFGLEYSKPSSLLLGIEAAYTTKKVTLKNKSWPSSLYPPFSSVSIGDVPIDGSYIELFAKVGYHIPLVDNKVVIKLFVGPSVSKQLRYIGDFRLLTEIYLNPEEVGEYKFDYMRVDSEGASNTSINSIIGAVVSYKSLGLEVRYERSYEKRDYMLDFSIKDKLDCFYILLRYGF